MLCTFLSPIHTNKKHVQHDKILLSIYWKKVLSEDQNITSIIIMYCNYIIIYYDLMCCRENGILIPC